MTEHPKTTDAIVGYGLITTELSALLQFRNMINGVVATNLMMVLGMIAVMTTFISYFYFLHKMDRYEEEQATNI